MSLGLVPTCSLVLGVIELFKASCLILTAVDALRARRIFARPKILYKFFIAYTVTSVQPNTTASRKPSDESDYIFIYSFAIDGLGVFVLSISQYCSVLEFPQFPQQISEVDF